MVDEDYPHQRKRFFEEYAAWTAVEQIAPAKLLTEMPAIQLMAKPMDRLKGEPRPAPMAQVTIKKVPEPLTEAQVRDRREMLRQQRDKCQNPAGEWINRDSRTRGRRAQPSLGPGSVGERERVRQTGSDLILETRCGDGPSRDCTATIRASGKRVSRAAGRSAGGRSPPHAHR